MTFPRNDQQKFWEQLKPFKPELYLSATLATLAAIGMLILSEAGVEGSFNNIVIALFRMFPEKFKLVSFPEHPDFIRIDNTLRLDCKHANLVIGNRVGGFSLTSHGKIMAEESLTQLRSGKSILTTQEQRQVSSGQRRNRQTRLVNEVRKSEAFRKYAFGKGDEIGRYDVVDVLHGTLDTDPRILKKNLEVLKQYAKDLVDLKEFRETATPVVEFLNFLESRWGGVFYER